MELRELKELMLELLTYEPYEKLISGEEDYIREILSENDKHQHPMLHALFEGFSHYVQRDVQSGNYKNIGWLQQWISTYKSGSRYYPLLFKKICFYIVIRGNFKDREFLKMLGQRDNLIEKFKISPQFRRYAEADTYSVIKSYRNGAKKKYIVSTVKKLYYEAGRQVRQEAEQQVKKAMTLNKMPTFVDVFAGTASVAASMGDSKEFPPPIVNDYDPAMVCFAWAFTYCQREICKRIVDFHEYVMHQDVKSTDLSYNAKDYERHYESIDPKSLLTLPQNWDDPAIQSMHMQFYGYSKAKIAEEKMLAQRHQEFVMRTRSSYLDVKKVLDLCDKDAVRDIINSNEFPKTLSKNQVEDILDYALATFYYYSFAPSGKNGNVYHETIVDAGSYLSYLRRIAYSEKNLHNAMRKNQAEKAKEMTEIQLEATSLTLESTGNFSRHLRGATFCCKDFKEILQDDSSQDGSTNKKIYYLDSPYFLTVGYDVGFSDDDHKAMLDILRDAKFKWIFSMQFNPSCRCKCTSASDEAKRKKQDHIIKDYGTYYRGFYAPIEVDADQRTYVVPDASMEDAENLNRLKELFVILFDFAAVEKKWPEMKTKTREMLVVNSNCLPTIPLHDTAVVLPFDLFLQCADAVRADAKCAYAKRADAVCADAKCAYADRAYQDIVQKAKEWRMDNIRNNYKYKCPV